MALVDPCGHAYPAVHGPAQEGAVAPGPSPNLPASHGPLQVGDASAKPAPKVPAGQGEHATAPPVLNLPAEQGTAVDVVDPAGQTYPALHGPLHKLVPAPAAAPNLPPGHASEHSAVSSADALPYLPGGHRVHKATPPREKVPGSHGTAVGVVDPAGQA